MRHCVWQPNRFNEVARLPAGLIHLAHRKAFGYQDGIGWPGPEGWVGGWTDWPGSREEQCHRTLLGRGAFSWSALRGPCIVTQGGRNPLSSPV